MYRDFSKCCITVLQFTALNDLLFHTMMFNSNLMDNEIFKKPGNFKSYQK